MAKRPNVLFLFTDDQRFDTVRELGNPLVHTPNMDALVRRGVSFTHAHIMGSLSGAVCICSRACVLTGNGVYTAGTNELAEGLAVWPEVFRQAGYVTFQTGKWHNDKPAFARSFARAETVFFGGMSNHLEVPVHDFDPAGEYRQEDRRIGKAFSSELFSDSAVRFLRDYARGDGDRPFFMYVSYTAPHDPRMAPRQYEALYPRDEIPLPENMLPEHPFDNGELRIRDENLAPFPRTPEVVREHIGAYYAMISHLDEHLGRVLAALDETNQADNTLIVFAGDNGLAVGQHGLMGKQNLYDHSIRVPLVFAGPDLPADERSDALVYLHDIFPTACRLAGLDVPETVTSRSLDGLISGDRTPVRESVFAGYLGCQRAVRRGDWKLIRYLPETRRPWGAAAGETRTVGCDRTQLFHLADDPAETCDLSADPAHADRIEGLKNELRRWQDAEGDFLDPIP